MSRQAKVADFGDRVEDSQFLNSLQGLVGFKFYWP